MVAKELGVQIQSLYSSRNNPTRAVSASDHVSPQQEGFVFVAESAQEVIFEKKMWCDCAILYPNCWLYRVHLTSVRKEYQNRVLFCLWKVHILNLHFNKCEIRVCKKLFHLQNVFISPQYCIDCLGSGGKLPAFDDSFQFGPVTSDTYFSEFSG